MRPLQFTCINLVQDQVGSATMLKQCPRLAFGTEERKSGVRRPEPTVSLAPRNLIQFQSDAVLAPTGGRIRTSPSLYLPSPSAPWIASLMRGFPFSSTNATLTS